MKATKAEKFQVQYLLPVQGSLQTLETVQEILDIIKIKPEDAESDMIEEIELSDAHISFLKNMISVLDQSQKLSLRCLPIIRKILKN